MALISHEHSLGRFEGIFKVSHVIFRRIIRDSALTRGRIASAMAPVVIEIAREEIGTRNEALPTRWRAGLI